MEQLEPGIVTRYVVSATGILKTRSRMEREMDELEQVASSEICVGVLGNGADFLLVRVGADHGVKEDAINDAIAAGLFYCGALGWSWTHGKMSAALEPDPDALMPMRLAALAFGEMVGRTAAPAKSTPECSPQGDAADWLERLHSLPDDRSTRD